MKKYFVLRESHISSLGSVPEARFDQSETRVRSCGFDQLQVMAGDAGSMIPAYLHGTSG